MKIMVAYYSHTGNTKSAAKSLADALHADLFRIEQLYPYSRGHKCVSEAENDQRQNARPNIKAFPENMDKYDTIYLGYPIFAGTMPMAIFTFLEKYDWSGKTIKPFCTHAGSGMGSSERDIKQLCHGANIGNGFAISGLAVRFSKSALKKWATK